MPQRSTRFSVNDARWAIGALAPLAIALGCGGEAQTIDPDAGAPFDGGAIDASDATDGNVADASDAQTDSAEADAPLSCDALGAAAKAAFDAILKAHRACAVDADCASVFTSGTCFAACGRAVRASDEAAVTSMSATLCQAFDAAGCKEPPVPCGKLPPAKCVSNQCANSS